MTVDLASDNARNAAGKRNGDLNRRGEVDSALSSPSIAAMYIYAAAARKGAHCAAAGHASDMVTASSVAYFDAVLDLDSTAGSSHRTGRACLDTLQVHPNRPKLNISGSVQCCPRPPTHGSAGYAVLRTNRRSRPARRRFIPRSDCTLAITRFLYNTLFPAHPTALALPLNDGLNRRQFSDRPVGGASKDCPNFEPQPSSGSASAQRSVQPDRARSCSRGSTRVCCTCVPPPGLALTDVGGGLDQSPSPRGACNPPADVSTLDDLTSLKPCLKRSLLRNARAHAKAGFLSN